MAQFASTFGSKERKAKRRSRGANYTHRRQSRAGVVQVFTADPGCEVNVIRDGDTFIVATFRNGRMDGKPAIHKNGYEAARANAQILAKVLKSSATPDPRSEVMLMVAALKADLS